MPLSCSGRSNRGGQGGIFRPSSSGSMIHLRCLGSHAELGAISMQAAAVLQPPLSDRSGGRSSFPVKGTGAFQTKALSQNKRLGRKTPACGNNAMNECGKVDANWVS